PEREWVQRRRPAIVEWAGVREVLPGVTLIQTGGHFQGSPLLHWAQGASGSGALLVGDTITVVPDVRAVSFMRSYPNLIPLPATEIRRIVASVRPYKFDRIYGGWWDRVTASDGQDAIERSARRYLKWIGADEDKDRSEMSQFATDPHIRAILSACAGLEAGSLSLDECEE